AWTPPPVDAWIERGLNNARTLSMLVQCSGSGTCPNGTYVYSLDYFTITALDPAAPTLARGVGGPGRNDAPLDGPHEGNADARTPADPVPVFPTRRSSDRRLRPAAGGRRDRARPPRRAHPVGAGAVLGRRHLPPRDARLLARLLHDPGPRPRRQASGPRGRAP